MAGILTVLIMAALLGAASFGIGMLPLVSSVSSDLPPISLADDEQNDSNLTTPGSRIAYLSTLGSGLLLGAALGIIIPEGIETVIVSSDSSKPPTSKIALSLLLGFAFMLVVEQLTSGHPHTHPHSHVPLSTEPPHQRHPLQETADTSANGVPKAPRTSQEEFDMALAELEGGVTAATTDAIVDSRHLPDPEEIAKSAKRAKAFPMTLGLVVHSLADGFALGASALPRAGAGEVEGNADSSKLSLVVFLALIIHKAPTALALSTSLLGTSISRSKCRKHIALFSASTPLGALGSFGALTFLGADSGGDWAGLALLVSGGTFLYVATVLQPDSSHSGQAHDMDTKIKVGLVILGMFIPFLIGLLVGHDH